VSSILLCVTLYVNIQQVVTTILTEFGINSSKAVLVTDRGANVFAAMKNWKHAILNLIQPEMAPLDPPSPKTPP